MFRVVQRRRGPRFLLETEEAFGIARHLRWQHFHGDVAVQSRIARAIHLAHPAFTEEGHHLVGA